jgi:hypothetical protein
MGKSKWKLRNFSGSRVRQWENGSKSIGKEVIEHFEPNEEGDAEV